jgi:uncharacterized protein
MLTARDHAQTAELAVSRWPGVVVIGGMSPSGRMAKAGSLARRAHALREFANQHRPDVALSHGSYAQIVGARMARVPAVTMMDYEFQPANHLSFRLAERVIVPTIFPQDRLRRFGADPEKVIRYPGFKEELYLTGLQPNPAVLAQLDLDPAQVVVVMRPPPAGALYHRKRNQRFDELVELARRDRTVQCVVLARSRQQAERYRVPEIRVPARAVDTTSLLAFADLTIGAGGTMNRESALLGTPTYTVFSGRLAAVDAELIRMGRLKDLRRPGARPPFKKKDSQITPSFDAHSSKIQAAVLSALREAVRLRHGGLAAVA